VKKMHIGAGILRWPLGGTYGPSREEVAHVRATLTTVKNKQVRFEESREKDAHVRSEEKGGDLDAP
jgi:hypothetical protein